MTAMRIRRGKLRHKIAIQQLSESTDSPGGLVDTWTTLAERMAEIVPMVGREAFNGQQEQSMLNVKFRLRYDSTLSVVTPKMQVIYDSRTFDIVSVVNIDERNIELIFMCEEVL